MTQDFTGKTVVITGAGHGIGLRTARAFLERGARVFAFDRDEIPIAHERLTAVRGDASAKASLETLAATVLSENKGVDVLVNNVPPPMVGLSDCTYEQFANALNIGVTSAFYLTKLFRDGFNAGASIINLSSSRDRMSQPETESYTAAKGGIAALTHALAVTLSGKVRVNSVSPGWIETNGAVWTGPDATQQPAGRVGHPGDIAAVILFLASEDAGFITGENITVDGGMTRHMIYHNDCGWKLEE